MSRRIMSWIGVMVISCTIPGISPAQEGKQVQAVLKVSGVLLTGNRSPLAGETVWFLPLSDNATVVQYKDGKTTNPRAVADQKGRFVLTIPREFGQAGSKFVVAFGPSADRAEVVRRDGAVRIFSIGLPARHTDVGDLIVKQE